MAAGTVSSEAVNMPGPSEEEEEVNSQQDL